MKINTIKWWHWIALLFVKPVYSYDEGRNDYSVETKIKYMNGKSYVVSVKYYEKCQCTETDLSKCPVHALLYSKH